MIQVQQEVQHWQHGVGVVLSIVNEDCLSVQFADKVRQCSGDNLTDLSNQPLLRKVVSQPTIDAVQLTIKKRRAALAARRVEMREGLTATCTLEQLANRLLNSEAYTLRLVGTEEGIERAQAEFISWTGESFPEEFIVLSTNRSQPRQWRFEFLDEPGVQYPFPVIMMGSQEHRYARLQDGVRGLYYSGSISMHYAEIVEQLVRLGLRGR